MIAALSEKTQVLIQTDVRAKLEGLSEALRLLLSGRRLEVPEVPGRDVQILPIRKLPAKRGLASLEGQARLLHDLASIELQAMELGVRTLAEFPEADLSFRHELAEVTFEEGTHLQLCLEAMDELGLPWGSFPTHVGLWQSVAVSDSLLDRIAIVHRYLEGSGLDASETILRRLSGVRASVAESAVRVIHRDERKHVLFGSHWYHRLVKEAGGDVNSDFGQRLRKLFARIPRRLEPISEPQRLAAGFLQTEIEDLEALRQSWLNPSSITSMWK